MSAETGGPVPDVVPWELYAAMRDRVERALRLIESFDPTSGTARAQVFAADLRRILEGTDGAAPPVASPESVEQP